MLARDGVMSRAKVWPGRRYRGSGRLATSVDSSQCGIRVVEKPASEAPGLVRDDEPGMGENNVAGLWRHARATPFLSNASRIDMSCPTGGLAVK